MDKRSFPRRPYLTQVFTTSLVFWISCALTFKESRQNSAALSFHVAILLIALSLLFIILFSRFQKHFVLLVCASLLAGSSLASAEATLLHTWAENGPILSLNNATIDLLQDTSELGYAPQALSQVQTEDGKRVIALVSFPDEKQYLCGQRIVVKGTISKADHGSSDYAWRNGASHLARVLEAQEQASNPITGFLISFRSKAIQVIGAGDDDWSVLQALVCGYRSNIKNTSLYASYQSSGLAHLVAVSGAHLVIVSGFASLLLKWARVPRRIAAPSLLILTCLYVIVAGVPLSAVRAAVMSSAGILSFFAKRRPYSLNALGLGIYGIIATCPHAALSASLALSALSTAGIVIFAQLIERSIERILPNPAHFMTSPLALTLAAAIPAQLYSCALFSQLPLVSPLSNLVCAPFFPLCCGLGLLGSMLACAGLPPGFAFLWLAHLCAKILDKLVVLIDEIPYGTVPISIDYLNALLVSLIACATIWLFWEKAANPRTIACLVSAILVFTVSTLLPLKPDSIAMLDVGQGDSFLIRSGRSSLLIDTGNKDSQLLDQLARLGAFHIDAVLVTHSDDDHCGSLDALARGVEVDTVFVAEDMLSCESSACRRLVVQAQSTAKNVCGLKKGDSFPIGKFTVQVLWPQSFQNDGGNEDSLVLDVSYDADSDGEADLTALFTGDAESGQIGDLRSEGVLEEVDILKVGHHGSANGLTAEQAHLLNPSIALIGVGEGNRYGHPTPETLDLLEEVGAQVFRTDQDGGVVLLLGKETVRASGF